MSGSRSEGFSYGSAQRPEIWSPNPGISRRRSSSLPLIDGIRSLVHMNGLGHFPRLMKAGLRDLGRAARAAEPFRIPATGPPESGAALCTRDAIEGFEAGHGPDSRWRNDLCARGVTEPPYRLERKVRRLRCPALYCIAEDDEKMNPPPELAERTDEERQSERESCRLYPGGHFEPFLGETFEQVVADQVGFLERKLLPTFSPSVSSISSTRTNLTRGRPCGSPRPTSAWSIACQSSKLT